MRREYFEVISLSTAGLDAHFWDLNAYLRRQPFTTWKVAPCNQTDAAFLTDFEALSVTLDRRFDAGAKIIPSSDGPGP